MKTIKEQVDEIERAIHPEGRCLDCGGGKPYWKHDTDHPFRYDHDHKPNGVSPFCKVCGVTA